MPAGNPACPNCAPGYDCANGVYEPGDPAGWTRPSDRHPSDPATTDDVLSADWDRVEAIDRRLSREVPR